MEVLSPRSANIPARPRDMSKAKADTKARVVEKPSNPDRIDDAWRPPSIVPEAATSERYVVGRKLGKGGFAVCFQAQSQSQGKMYALKVVKARVEQKKMAEKFRTELQIHAKMQHPNIVDFLRAFTHHHHTYVVLEICPNGNLTDMVKARSCLSLPEVRRFLIQICAGVRYMHKRNVIHRDLKMGNIFLDANMNIKIGDFGLAAVMADESDRRTTLCGTPNYIAPEILSKSGSRGHDNKVDTWAIGIICYAMLVGTPPFQSKTQQEIYAKLKTLEYEWKVDCQNYIPHQAKALVASCLNLVSAERPEMDDLVEHDFFTMGVIADNLDSSCLRHKPDWLLPADPRGDNVRPGYGIAHSQACSAAGVGRAPGGSPRPGVGGKCEISALVEIEAENVHGTAPTIPLPEGLLYNAFTEAQADWIRRQKQAIQPATKPRSRKPVHDTEAAPQPTSSAYHAHHARSMPSFAAQQRQQALPARTLTRQVKQPLPVIDDGMPSSSSGEPITAPAAEGLLRARPVRAASTRTTRSTTAAQKARSEAVRLVPKSSSVPAAMDALGQSAANNAPMPASPTARPKSAQSVYSAEPDLQALPSTSANAAQQPHDLQSGLKVRLPHPSYTSIRCNPRLICPTDYTSLLPGTSADAVLLQLHDLHTKLGMRHSPQSSSSLSSRRARARTAYPRVEKWVDYSSKHGIAYILTDGTLGMVIKSSSDNVRPSACVVVRNARKHTIQRARGTVAQLIPQGPAAKDVEFYEQSDLSKDMSKCTVPATAFNIDEQRHGTLAAATNAVQSTMSASLAEKFRELVLLDKFGKYMHKRHDDSEVDDTAGKQAAATSEHFVHFYQRVGNVGVWRFADGGLQFNFPDHTKLTVYLDRTSRIHAYLVDLIYLEPVDALALARSGSLTTEALERRNTITLALGDLAIDNFRGAEADIVRSNQVKQKLLWIRAVIGCWCKEGGVGRLGDERLGWSGLQERREPAQTKLAWVTVGRAGGDGDGAV
ncbi:hypothetical protein DV737_g4027, partial [Chaetothyriales sp. CBS 132003]